MAGHAQLKFVTTECSKTQIRLTGLVFSYLSKKKENEFSVTRCCAHISWNTGVTSSTEIWGHPIPRIPSNLAAINCILGCCVASANVWSFTARPATCFKKSFFWLKFRTVDNRVMICLFCIRRYYTICSRKLLKKRLTESGKVIKLCMKFQEFFTSPKEILPDPGRWSDTFRKDCYLSSEQQRCLIRLHIMA